MSDRENAASDIAQGSAWNSVQRVDRATVLSTGGGYVRYSLASDRAPRVLHHVTFRALYEPLFDRRQVRSQFSMTCANLAEFDVFWNPMKRKIIARSVTCSRRFALPAGVVKVGTYSSPFSAEDFLNDLDCLLATNDHPPALAAAPGV